MLWLKTNLVNISIGLVFFYSAWLSGNLGGYDQPLIDNDVVWYHSYAPALFVKHDLKLNFYKDSSDYYCSNKMYCAILRGNDNPIIKTTCGQSLMFLPFTAWVFMYYSGDNITGYEAPFSSAICISTLFYFLFSLLLLKRILRHFEFSEINIALTIICLGLGTNMLGYTTWYWGMAHINGFFLVCSLMYLTIKWFQNPGVKVAALLGLCIGLLILIRPTNILFIILIPLYNVNGLSSLKQNLKFIAANVKLIFVMVIVGVVVLLPQLLYWKYVTGQWIYFSYVGEQFFYGNPHLIDYVLGFRKGWLIYSPLIVLALIGLFFRRNKKNVFLYATLIIIAISVYLNSSWWCWWFGGGFGARSMIEVYPLLAIGFCNFFGYFQLNKIRSWVAGLLLTFLVLHNVKSSYLSRINKIHYDSMTYAAYKYLFFKIVVTPEDDKVLETLYVHPDYDQAKKGINT